MIRPGVFHCPVSISGRITEVPVKLRTYHVKE
jgi:hypothetical protein